MYIPRLAAAVLCAAAVWGQTGYSRFVVTGGPSAASPYGPAFTAGSSFYSVAADAAGNIYATDSQVIQKFTPEGEALPVMGYGAAIVAPGDRIPAILAATGYANALATDSAGNLFVASAGVPIGTSTGGIYRVSADGLVELYAATPANSVAVDAAGNVYALTGARVIRIAPDRSVTTVAGTGQPGLSGDGGPGTAAEISATRIAVDGRGNLFIADVSARIRKVDPAGIITTVAQVRAGDMAADRAGNLYFAEAYQVGRLAPDGSIDTIAGAARLPLYRGDVGPALSAWLVGPYGLALDPGGNLYLADGQRLRKVDTNGVIHSVAGCPCFGDGVPSTWAQVGSAIGIVRDTNRNTYFSDQTAHMVRRIAPDGTVSTIAGNGEAGFSGDEGPATAARLAYPSGLALDDAGSLYIADEQNSRIRKVGVDGVIRTVAGNGTAGFTGDGGPAASASLALPDGVAVDSSGNLYIADSANHRIRRVTTDGVIRTIAGTDLFGSSGDGGPATQAQLINPRSLVFDRNGNLLFTDSSARMVRRITPAGTIERVAGTGDIGVTKDGVPAVSAQLDFPWGIAVDGDGSILIGDSVVHTVDPGGTIHNIALPGGRGIAAGGNGDLWLAAGSVVVLSQSGPPFPLAPSLGPTLSNPFTNNPFTTATAALAPGEIVSFTGARLGPERSVNSTETTVVATTLAGTRLLFDGTPAPLLSVSSGNITAVTPYRIAARPVVSVEAEVEGLRSRAVTYRALPAAPQWITGGVPFCYPYASAAALNEDGSLNGYFNPAPRGSIVSLFATGAGEWTQPVLDGTIILGPPLPVPALPVSVTFGSRALEVTYAGAVPGYVSGGLQVNVRLPTDLAPSVPQAGVPVPYYPLDLRVGDAKSGTACVLIR